MWFDGGRVGVNRNLVSYIKSLRRNVRRTMHIMKDPILVEARVYRLRSALATFTCMESMHNVARNCTRNLVGKHKRDNGILKTNVISPVAFPLGT